MPVRLPTDDGPSEKDSFLPTTDIKRPSTPRPTPAPPASHHPSTARKIFVAAVGSITLGLLAFNLLSCEGPPGGGAWGEVREGWGMVRHGRGSRWADRHGFEGFFDEHERALKVDWLAQSAGLPSLALTAPVGSANPVADVSLVKGARHVVVALGPDVHAEVALVHAASASGEASIGRVTIESLDGEVRQDAVRVLSGELSEARHKHRKYNYEKDASGLAGVVIHNCGRYLVTVILPSGCAGRPIDLTLQGDRLTLADGALDFAGLNIGRFELAASTGEDAVVKNLHAHEAAIQLTSGAIKGSFNVSGELTLATLVGGIEANVSIFENPDHHRHHKHGKHNETASVAEQVEMAAEGSSSSASIEARKEKPHHPPHDGPHPHPPPPPPHHRPKHLIKVLAKAGIGSVALTFVDDHLPSNKTSLLAVAKAEIGDVALSVLPGFKGVFAEGARIGEVEFANPGGSKIVIDKEKHVGPGGFVKGFVGERPKDHHDHHHKHHHHDDDKHPKHPKEPKKPTDDDAAVEAELYPFRHDEEARLGRHRQKHVRPANDGEEEDDDDRRPERRHRKHDHDDKDEGGHHKHPHHPPPPSPCHRPHGPPHHPMGPPPPGYGFAGAFAGTGKIDIVFR